MADSVGVNGKEDPQLNKDGEAPVEMEVDVPSSVSINEENSIITDSAKEEAGTGGESSKVGASEAPATSEPGGDVVLLKGQEKAGKNEESGKVDSAEKSANWHNDDDFVVLEEDDVEGEDKDQDDSTATTTEDKSSAAVGTSNAEATKDKAADGEGNKGDEKKQDDTDDEVMLVNPLFNKVSAKGNGNNVPVYDIDSGSSDDEGQDFSMDVKVENFQHNELVNDGWNNVNGNMEGQPCGYSCFQEKGILISEIERLRQAIFELSERHAVIEDFIEVEHGESFDKFLKNREHLVNMGFGTKDSDSHDVIDGKRSAKSSELVELLKMIKEQADINIKEEKSDEKSPTEASYKKQSHSSQSKQPQRNNNSSRQQQKSKPIPTVGITRVTDKGTSRDRGSDRGRGSDRDREISTYGRGGALNYQHRHVSIAPPPPPLMQQPTLLSRNPHANAPYQYQQEHMMGMMAPPQTLPMAAAQSRYYNDVNSAIAQYGGGGYRNKREGVTAVGRNDVISSTPYGYGFNSRQSDTNSQRSSAAGSDESKQIKKQRKRKRQSETESAASSAGNNIPSSSGAPPKSQNPGSSGGGGPKVKVKPVKDLEDELYDMSLNPGAKRICPICSKILSRKHLRDHITVHLGYNITCPMCHQDYYMRKRLKLHLRDDHDMPLSEYSVFLDKLYLDLEGKIGGKLDEMVKGAEVPTRAQLIEYNNAMAVLQAARKEQKMAAAAAAAAASGEGMPSERERNPSVGKRADVSSSRRVTSASESSGGRGSSSGNQRRQPQQQFQGAPAPNIKDNSELYGPGGYAQYAARYLQQRSQTAAPVNRLYTPF